MFRVELKKCRENAGLSQCELAENIGVSQAAVGMWESGKREPNFTTLCKLADYFGVTVDYLIGHDVSQPVRVVSTPKVSDSDLELLRKFHTLNDVDRARILNMLDYDYRTAISQESAKSSNSTA